MVGIEAKDKAGLLAVAYSDVCDDDGGGTSESAKWLIGRLDDIDDGVGVTLLSQSSLTAYESVPVLVNVSSVLNSEGYSSDQESGPEPE